MSSLEIRRKAAAVMNTRYGEFNTVAFEMNDGTSHIALIKGEGEVPVVRIQSHCLTSTAFHSVLCDCADQVEMALEQMNQSPYSMLIYLDQEGRGHGLISKIEVMNYLNQGMDIVSAQQAAGRAEDRRDYSYVKLILQELGLDGPVDILTNNPQKMADFRTMGLNIRNRVPLIVKPKTEQQANYLTTKKTKMGHWL